MPQAPRVRNPGGICAFVVCGTDQNRKGCLAAHVGWYGQIGGILEAILVTPAGCCPGSAKTL